MKKQGITKIVTVYMLIGMALLAMPVSAQKSGSTLFALFKDSVPAGAQWRAHEKSIRKGGYTKNSTHYVYTKPAYGPAELTGLSIPIRENPGPGEFRYITFTYVKWGGGQVGLRFAYDEYARANGPGKKYDYGYYAGKGDEITVGLRIEEEAPSHWMVTTRDLWKDFGDFTLTGLSFLCPTGRDAGFDAVLLGKNPDDFEGVPGILPTKVGASVVIEDDEITLDESFYTDDYEDDATQQVQIDWAAQIKAGGVWMYPLYLLGVVALVIALQRMVTSRSGRLAPKKLRKTVAECMSRRDIEGALAACGKYPSTLAASLQYLFKYWKADKNAVCQTAGDMVARDIRAHLARIYPLSVIASVAPLLGLLGTIVGMIEAFGLVALYGDEGGASILSDSISKALITTAAGLIIAAPSVCLYFIIKNRITRLSSLVEVELEKVITELYLTEEGEPNLRKEE